MESRTDDQIKELNGWIKRYKGKNKEMEEKLLEVPQLKEKNKKLAKLLKEIQGQLTEIVTHLLSQ